MTYTALYFISLTPSSYGTRWATTTCSPWTNSTSRKRTSLWISTPTRTKVTGPLGRCSATSATSTSGLVDDLLRLIRGTDRGSSVPSPEKRAEIDTIIQQLATIGAKTQQPMEDSGLFGNYEVVYTSAGSSQRGAPAGGLFRGRLGRLLFRTRGLFQHLLAPNVVINLVCFRMLGLLKGSVGLRGTLARLDDAVMGPNAVQVTFESPRLCFGNAVFQFGPKSRVELATTYVDDRVRLGVGSRGSLFVFAKGESAETPTANEWKPMFQAKPLPVAVVPIGVLAALALTFLAPSPVRVAFLILMLMFGLVLNRGGIVQENPGL